MEKVSESRRLETLKSLQILDSLPEQTYDDIVRLAAAICGTPVAAISLVDENRQWFKSILGFNATETPRDIAFCSHTIQDDQILHVPDAREDTRFRDNPLVIGDPNVRFYAGAPLIFSDGSRLGSLCVIDTQPNSLNDSQKSALEILARQVIAHLELRQNMSDLKSSESKLRDQQNFLDVISSHLPGVIYRARQETPTSFSFQYMSHGAERLFGLSIGKILGGPAFSSESVHPSDRENFIKALDDSVQLKKPFSWQGKIRTMGKVQNWIRVNANPIQSADGVIWHGVILDINQEKLLEVEVQNSQDKMSEAQKVISLARMASGLAREISHPLAVIKGMSEIFGQTVDLTTLSEGDRGMIAESVQANVKRIEDIVNYLEVSSNDDVSENFSSFPLRQILDNALHSAKSVISLVNLDIEVRLPPAMLSRCRPTRFSQVLREILINACEADFKKDPRLQIVGYMSDNAIRIEFEDSGQVISPEIATYIFDPFFSTKQSGVGRGLGLSRSRAIVEAHGGTLVYDDSRFASTFILTLPHVSLLEES